MAQQSTSLSTSKTLLHQESSTSHRAETSPNGTVFYSLSEADEESSQKRQNEGNAEPRTRKKYKYVPPTPLVPIESFKIEEPNWEEHPKAWGFLQSQNPAYPSKYLEKIDPTSHRPGYVLGRKQDSDIVFKREDISKSHCLIYMETGANSRQKGIRIFLKDTSFNGTYVNGHLIGFRKRILLRNGNKIQLIKPPSNPELEDMRHKFYKILFPPSYEANTCENVYKFTRVLGKGNFAVVSHAENRQTGEEVAIKILNKARFERKPKMEASIIEEVSIMMSLHEHPLLVKMKNIYNEQSKIFLVLEYVPGGELFNYVVDRKLLDERQARFIFWQLLTAIKFLHSNNIVHRDLKPENVLLMDKETLHVKISDFGLAKTEYRDQAFGSQCGTPNYVAPEILDPSESRAYDRKCDLWSLGVILYICLCGYPPFSEEKAPPAMKTQIKKAIYSFDSPFWDHISAEAKDLIKHLLTVNPVDRITVDEALSHDWLHMDESYMETMKQGLGKENLEQIEQLGNPEYYSLTQIHATQSQSLQ